MIPAAPTDWPVGSVASEDIVWPDPIPARVVAPEKALERYREEVRALYLDELEQMTRSIEGLRGRVREVVALARTAGATWAAIADAIGTTRQSACHTYGPNAIRKTEVDDDWRR